MITVNRRDEVVWREGVAVTDLLEAMSYTHAHIIVSIDGVLVPHDAYQDTPVPDGAEVLVIHIQAGG